MSIVDRALRPASATQERQTVAPREATSVARARESIKVNFDFLREQGVVPTSTEEIQRREDEFRRIKWPLLASAFGSESEQIPDGDLVLITSAVPGEGKTFVAANLALSIARERSCGVLLVDADIERQRLSVLFDVTERRGLTELLSAPETPPEQFVLDTDVPRLSILPAGQRVQNSPELLAGDGLQRLVRWFSATYAGYVLLFDSPPLLARTEAQVLARGVGQVVFVLRADSTQRSVVQDALALLPGGPLVRCVLNQTQRSALAGYYGGYSNYGEEGRS
jgi:protein-tyrosine kinase